MNQDYTRAPHRPPSADMPQHSAALLIDFDNVTMGIRSNLGQELRNLLDSDVIRGKVAVQRAYADWRRYPQYIVPLSEVSIDLIFAPAYGSSKKNATDIRLAIDATELVFTRPEISTFILLSGDSDFSSLVLKLKEYGKYVIGVGLQESTSDILVQNCDEYYSYNRLSGLTSSDEVQTQKHDPWELARTAVARMVERGDVMRSDRLKQVMLEIDPSFDERTTGFSKFNRFLGEASQRELITLRKRDNGQYDVGPVSGDATTSPSGSGASPAASSPEPRSGSSRSRRGRGRGRGRSDRGRGHERSPSGGKPDTAPVESVERASTPISGSSESLQAAYQALAEVVDRQFEAGGPIRDSMAKRKLLERDASFDEKPLGFAKFSRFLRQAHDEGIVDMEQADDGNYYLKPAQGADAHLSRRGGGSAGGKAESGSSRGRRSEAAGGRAARSEKPRETTAPDAGSAPPAEAGRKDGSALGAAAAAARRTLSRLRRGASTTETPVQRSEARSQVGPVEDAASPEPQDAAPEPKDAAPEPKDAAPKDEPKEAPPTRESAAPTPESKDVGPGPGRRGRDRASQSRGARPKPERQERASRPEPKRAEASSSPASDVQESAPPAAEDSAPPAPRRMGRYRSGSRGRSAQKPRTQAARPNIGPISDEELGGSSTEAGSGSRESGKDKERKSAPREDVSVRAGSPASTPSGAGPAQAPAGGPVDHMVRNYAGVGKRTAEVLFERFGEQVFEVIDGSPNRLTEVLSEGRARVVIEARRSERESQV